MIRVIIQWITGEKRRQRRQRQKNKDGRKEYKDKGGGISVEHRENVQEPRWEKEVRREAESYEGKEKNWGDERRIGKSGVQES